MITLSLENNAFAEKVCSVYDGDTFTLCTGQRIRLFGVQAPELKDPGGIKSRNYLKQLILDQDVKTYCKAFRPSGKRKVCVARLNGQDLAKHMVKAGFAKDWSEYSGFIYAE